MTKPGNLWAKTMRGFTAQTLCNCRIFFLDNLYLFDKLRLLFSHFSVSICKSPLRTAINLKIASFKSDYQRLLAGILRVYILRFCNKIFISRVIFVEVTAF